MSHDDFWLCLSKNSNTKKLLFCRWVWNCQNQNRKFTIIIIWNFHNLSFPNWWKLYGNYQFLLGLIFCRCAFLSVRPYHNKLCYTGQGRVLMWFYCPSSLGISPFGAKAQEPAKWLQSRRRGTAQEDAPPTGTWFWNFSKRSKLLYELCLRFFQIPGHEPPALKKK